MTADDLPARVRGLETKCRRIQAALCISVGLLAVLATTAAVRSPPDVVRAKGLVIEDAAGKPRVLIGAPIPVVPGRRRKDPLTGLVFLGGTGADNVILGESPDVIVNGKLYPRRVRSTGILIHDRDGNERGGYSVDDEGSAVLTLDWATAEGFSAVVDEKRGRAETSLWYRRPIGIYKKAVSMGVTNAPEEAYLKFRDPEEKDVFAITRQHGKPVAMETHGATWDGRERLGAPSDKPVNADDRR